MRARVAGLAPIAAVAALLTAPTVSGAATQLGQLAPTPTNCAGNTNHVKRK